MPQSNARAKQKWDVNEEAKCAESYSAPIRVGNISKVSDHIQIAAADIINDRTSSEIKETEIGELEKSLTKKKTVRLQNIWDT